MAPPLVQLMNAGDLGPNSNSKKKDPGMLGPPNRVLSKMSDVSSDIRIPISTKEVDRACTNLPKLHSYFGKCTLMKVHCWDTDFSTGALRHVYSEEVKKRQIDAQSEVWLDCGRLLPSYDCAFSVPHGFGVLKNSVGVVVFEGEWIFGRRQNGWGQFEGGIFAGCCAQ